MLWPTVLSTACCASSARLPTSKSSKIRVTAAGSRVAVEEPQLLHRVLGPPALRVRRPGCEGRQETREQPAQAGERVLGDHAVLAVPHQQVGQELAQLGSHRPKRPRL